MAPAKAVMPILALAFLGRRKQPIAPVYVDGKEFVILKG
jgi:hypothetical protein